MFRRVTGIKEWASDATETFSFNHYTSQLHDWLSFVCTV